MSKNKVFEAYMDEMRAVKPPQSSAAPDAEAANRGTEVGPTFAEPTEAEVAFDAEMQKIKQQEVLGEGTMILWNEMEDEALLGRIGQCFKVS